MSMKKQECVVCQKAFDLEVLHPLSLMRTSVWEILSRDYPTVRKEGYICPEDHKKYKKKYLRQIIQEDFGTVSPIEQEVIESIEGRDFLAENVNETYEDSLTLLIY